jgi:hypothetical protein
MKQAVQAATTTEHPLEPGDLSLLRTLRASQSGTLVAVAVLHTMFVSGLVAFSLILFDLGMSDSHAPAVLAFCAVLAALAGFTLYGGARSIRLFRGVGAVLRNPQRAAKQVSRGELAGLSREDGAIRYDLGGESFPVWLPIPHANGNIKFAEAVPHLDGLMHQRVVLERLEIAGAPAPLLLRADYPGYPPMVAERAATEQECREVAASDVTGLVLGFLAFGILFLLILMLALFGLAGGLPVLLIGVALFEGLRRKLRRWAQIRPRTLSVTGVVAEVVDSVVSIGRYSERQRWYRIGDRLYPTGRAVPEDESITCGSVVRMDYLDRSLRGGRILRIEPLAD